MEAADHNSQFCFVVASFNNELNIEKNLTSLITQTNTNWRCVYINDCSTDNTELLFFELVTKHNVKSKFTYVKNDKRYGQTYSKYTAYKLVKDFEIVCILDGDDWLADSDVVTRLTKVYSDKNVEMVSSNFNVWNNGVLTENPNFTTYSEDILTSKQFRNQPDWLVRHLKTGYGIFFKSIPKEYLTINNEWLKVCSDIAEYYSALELSNGKYLAIDDRMYNYNKTNSLNYDTSFYKEESKDLHKNILDYLLALPPCKYSFPKTYIINMAKCTKKRDYMEKQMLFQCNTNFKFIEAIDGSNNSETNVLTKKYFEYMNVKHPSQSVEFHRSIMVASYKYKYNFKRQHLTRGALGLIQSSFLLMSEFVESDEDHVLILEDDVYTMKNLDKNLFINKELLRGKDLVYLGCHTSKNNIFPEKSDSIFIDILNYQHLIYGSYSIIISKRLAQYILSLGIDRILRLNLSWDLFLNYIRDTEKQRFTFFLYFKQVFIPNVIKRGGINPTKDLSFYTNNNVRLHDYYIPEVTNEHTNNDIGTIMSTHTEDNFFFEFISKVVYINLEDRLDRKKHIEGQLSKYINTDKICRFNAVKNIRGAIGCGLSHIAVLEMAIAENWDNVFIAEDDLTWTADFTSGYNILENLIREEYDVIVLGGSFVKSYKDSFKLISCNCALAYIVNNSYYQKLLDCFKKGVYQLTRSYNQSRYAIDQVWKPLQRHDNWYVIKPNMCVQLPSYSNIENDFKDYTRYFNNTSEYDDMSAKQLINSIEHTSLNNTLGFKNKPETKAVTSDTPIAVNTSTPYNNIVTDSDSVVFNGPTLSKSIFNPQTTVVSRPVITPPPRIVSFKTLLSMSKMN